MVRYGTRKRINVLQSLYPLDLRLSLRVASWIISSVLNDEALDLMKWLQRCQECYLFKSCLMICGKRDDIRGKLTSIAISVGVSLETSSWPCLDAISANARHSVLIHWNLEQNSNQVSWRIIWSSIVRQIIRMGILPSRETLTSAFA